MSFGQEDVHEEHFAERERIGWRSLLAPLWFTALAVAAAWALGGVNLPAAIAYLALLFVAVQEFRGGWASVRELTVRANGLMMLNPYGRRSELAWNELEAIDTVDRGRAHPRRMIRLIADDGRSFFLSDRLERFGQAFDLIRVRAPHAVVRPMSLRDKLVWLQWGA